LAKGEGRGTQLVITMVMASTPGLFAMTQRGDTTSRRGARPSDGQSHTRCGSERART
jgi:hypothetical protein